LSVSFPVDSALHSFTDSGNVQSVETYLKEFLIGVTGREWSLSEPKLGKGRNFFENSCNFHGGFIAWGGNNTVINKLGVTETRPEKIQVYFDAAGCFHLATHDQGEVSGNEILRDKINELKGRITRVDVALDFHNGEVTIDQLEWAYKEGKFTKTAKPSAKRITDIDQGSTGDTLYIGNRKNGKMLRGYEKGKQLGSINSQWVRLEVELHATDRELNPDILVNHAAAFAQSYPYLAELVESFGVETGTNEKMIQNTKKKTSLTVEQQFRHAQRTYGKLITTASQTFGDYGLGQDSSNRLIVQLLHRAVDDGLPRSLEHQQKNLLQDCVVLHTLYSVGSLDHDGHRMS